MNPFIEVTIEHIRQPRPHCLADRTGHTMEKKLISAAIVMCPQMFLKILGIDNLDNDDLTRIPHLIKNIKC